jgi:hypothetical protein
MATNPGIRKTRLGVCTLVQLQITGGASSAPTLTAPPISLGGAHPLQQYIMHLGFLTYDGEKGKGG